MVEKKIVEDLMLQLEALTLEHSKCEKSQKALKKKFEDACVELATLTQQLKDARSSYDEATLETSRLRMEVRQLSEKGKKKEEELIRLRIQSTWFAGEVLKGNETIDLLS